MINITWLMHKLYARSGVEVFSIHIYLESTGGQLTNSARPLQHAWSVYQKWRRLVGAVALFTVHFLAADRQQGSRE